jgi:CheY-like chemotaxis protein
MAAVLIVDDIKDTRDRLRRLIAAEGHQVVEAADGKDALTALHGTPAIDVIVLDLVMPGVSGWEFRELQLEDARMARIPTIIITARSLADHDRYALRVAKTTVIQKPFEDAAVIDALTQVMTRR